MKRCVKTGRPKRNVFAFYQRDKDLGNRIPWYMGRAWYHPDIRVTVFIPVPLNYILSWVREGFWFLRGGRMDIWDKVYDAGVKQGREQGRRIGHAEGYTVARQEALDLIDKFRQG